MIATLALAIVPVQSHAVSEAVMIGMMSSMADAYGMSYGIGTTYDVTSTNGVTESFQGLWDDFSAYQTSQGKPSKTLSETWVTMQARNENMAQRYEGTYEHQSGNFVAYDYDEESASVFDEFWNWLLKIHVGLTVEDNQYQWNTDSETGEVQTETVSTSTEYQFLPISVIPTGLTTDEICRQGTRVCAEINDRFSAEYFIAITNAEQGYAYCTGDGGSQIYAITSSNGATASFICKQTNAEDGTVTYPVHQTYQSMRHWNAYFKQFSASYTDMEVMNAPYYDDSDTAILAFVDWNGVNETTVTASINPYRNATITLPDISAEDYTPVAVTIPTSQNWNDERYGDIFPLPDDSLANLVDDSLELASTNELELIVDEAIIDPIVPSPEYNPLLPSNLPSFNFSFSGIWHYVVEWVATLGDWFTAMFSMWSALPYAMVLPVYATAVIVIVLGVYKRFFM